MRQLSDMAKWGNRALWVLVVLTLPFTSFPMPLPGLRYSVVRPLSLLPLLVLLLTYLIPYTLRGGRFPRAVLPLAAFTALSLASTLWGLSDPTMMATPELALSRALRAWATLGIGLAYFAVTAAVCRDRRGLMLTLRALYAAFAVTGVWSLIQASVAWLGWPSFDKINRVQEAISLRSLVVGRVQGFAYEPAWLASQLTLLLLPFVLAGLLTGVQVVGRGKLGRAAEVVLLLLSLTVLILTFSRGGILSFLVIAGLVVLTVRRQRIASWFRSGGRAGGGVLVWRIATAAGVLAVISLGLIWSLSRSDYFRLLWEEIGSGDFYTYVSGIGAGARVALQQAAWDIFLRHPILGVGLGLSGIHMLDALPAWSLNALPEIMELMVPSSTALPNVKSLWLRVIAETGTAGASAFFLFLAGAVVTILALWDGDRQARFLAWAGCLILPLALLQGHTLDSFATPTLWVALGVLMGGGAGLQVSLAASHAEPATTAPATASGAAEAQVGGQAPTTIAALDG